MESAAPARRSPLDPLVLTLSSALGLGYLPKAPGTWGSLAAIPLWYAMRELTVGEFALVTAFVIAAAVAIAHRAEHIYGGHDAQRIVIDEVAGLLTTAVGVPFAWPEVLAAFVVFRIFDMWKPQPIRWIDRHVGGGLGVVLDDVAAGVVGLALLQLARLALGRWW